MEVNILNYREKLATEIRKERATRRLTQEQLAKEVNISRLTIVSIESTNYTKEVKLTTIQSICTYLKIPVIMQLGDVKD